MERYRTTLIMAALLVALGVTAMLLNNNNAGTRGTPTPVPAIYVWESTEPISGLEVTSGTQKIVLRNDQASSGWVLEQPVSGPADNFAVPTVADSLKSLVAKSVLTDSANLADFGLDKQGLSVTTTFSGTTAPRTLQVGGPTFDGSGYYVKTRDAGKVYVVSNSTIEPLKSWLTAPPVAPPTATPPQLTIGPTATQTPPGVPTATPTSGASSQPTSGVATATFTSGTTTLPTSGALTGTATLTTTSPITSTSPGAASPTTPLPAASPGP